MPSKHCCAEQDSKCLSLGAKVDLLGEAMPVLCTCCLLLQEKGEKVECKVFPNYFCCGECCCQGHANCDTTGVEDSDCLFFLFLFLILSDPP